MPAALSMDLRCSSWHSQASVHRHYFNGRLACDKDGKILAGEFDAGIDHGAYPEMGDDKADKDPEIHVLSRTMMPNVVGLGKK